MDDHRLIKPEEDSFQPVLFLHIITVYIVLDLSPKGVNNSASLPANEEG